MRSVTFTAALAARPASVVAAVVTAALAASLALPGCGGSQTDSGPTASSSAAARPDVLVICIDVLRADHVGALGRTAPTTPWIDRLAREGVSFVNVRSVASWTKPSVPSYFTGRYPHQHGVYEGSRTEQGRLVSDVLPDDETTMAELFHAAGYRTAAFVNNAQIDGDLGFAQGFDVYADDSGDAADIRARFLSWLGSGDDGGRSGDDARTTERRSAPFFAYLHFLDIHWPYTPDSPYLEMFDPPDASVDFFTPAWKTLKDTIRDGTLQLGDRDRQAMIDLYDAELRATDREIGRVLEALRTSGRLDDTLVVFLADHGEEFLEHGGIGHGNSLFGELLRVPLIVRMPRAAHAGRMIDAPASLVDVLPTLVDACSLAVPEGLAGRSLLPYVGAGPPGDAAPSGDTAGDARREPAERLVYAEGVHGDRYQQTLIENGRWKYVSTVFLGKDGDEEDAPDARDSLKEGTRIEAEGVVVEDGLLLAEEVILQDDQEDDREKVTGSIDRIVRGPGAAVSLEVLGFRVPIDPEDPPDVEEDSGSEITLGDLRQGDVVKVYGHVAAADLLRPVKIKRRDPERRRKTKLEGPIVGTPQREHHTVLLRVAGRDVRISGSTDVLTQQWQRILDEKRKRRDAKEPAATPSRDPLAEALELGIPPDESLYDLAEDPAERRDVAAANPDVVRRLRERLNDLRRPSTRTRSAHTLGDADEARLRALGYIK